MPTATGRVKPSAPVEAYLLCALLLYKRATGVYIYSFRNNITIP
jgi:hypothetical protein